MNRFSIVDIYSNQRLGSGIFNLLCAVARVAVLLVTIAGTGMLLSGEIDGAVVVVLIHGEICQYFQSVHEQQSQ